jgi:hypothetical protein
MGDDTRRGVKVELSGFNSPYLKKSVIENKSVRALTTVSGLVRSVRRSGRNRIGELLDSSGDPAQGIGTVVIAGNRELVGTCDAFFKRFSP